MRQPRRLLLACLALLAALAAAGLALQLPAVGTRVANLVLARVPTVPGARLWAREVRGSWLADLELRGLRVARGDTALASVDTLRARYRLAELLLGRVRLLRLELDGVAVSAEIAAPRGPRPPRPPLGLADVLRGRFYDGPALVADRLTLGDGRYGGYAGAPDSGWRFRGVTLAARDVRLGGGFAFAIDSLAFAALPPGSSGPLTRATLSGALAGGRAELAALRVRSAGSDLFAGGALALDARDSLQELRVRLRAHPLALGELAHVVPGLDLEGELAADVEARGPRPDRLTGLVRAELGPARVGALRLTPSRLRAELRDGRADLSLATGSADARLDVAGWIRPLAAVPEYDATLRLDRLPGRLPGVAGWETLSARLPLAAELRVRGRGYADAAVEVSGGARGAAGELTLDARFDAARGPAWEVRRLAFRDLDLARLAGDPTPSALTGELAARGRGASPESLRGTAELRLGPSHYGRWRLHSAAARARAEGAAVTASLEVDIEGGALAVTAAGIRRDGRMPFRVSGLRFDRLDLGVLTGNPELTSDLSGTAELAGQARPPLTATGRVNLEPSRLRGRTLTGGAAEISYERGTLTLDAELASDAGRVSARAAARPFASPPEYVLHELRFAEVDARAWADAAPPTRLAGHITAVGRAASAAPGDPPDTWQASLRLEESRVGALRLAAGEADLRLTGRAAEVTGSLSARGGTATFTGSAAWDTLAPGRRAAHGRAALVTPLGLLAGLAGRDSLETEGAVRADAEFALAPGGEVTASGVLAGRGRLGAARLDTLFATVRYAGGAVVLDTLGLRSDVGHAAAAGRLALADSAAAPGDELRITAAITDPAPLAPLLGADTLGLAAGELEVTLSGPPAARAFRAAGSLRSLAWDDLRVLRARAEAHGTLARDGRPDEVHARAEVGRVHTPFASVQEIRAVADVAGREARFDLDAGLDEKHRVRLAGTATEDSAGHTLVLTAADVDADTARWRLVRPARLRLTPGRLELADFEARAQTGVVRAAGVVDRRGEQDFRFEARDLGLDLLTAWLGRDDLTGGLEGRFSLTGPAAAPRGEGSLRLAALHDGAPAGVLGSQITWDGREVRLAAAFTSPQGDSLQVAGRLPLALSLAAPDSGRKGDAVRAFAGDVDLRLTADRFPLRALAPFLPARTVSALNGTFDADARLAGTGEQLVGTGQLAIADGYVALPALGVTYRSVRLDGALSGSRLLLREARATSGKGDLRATGEVRFASFTRTELDLAVTARRFTFLDTPDLRAVASGEWQLAGTAAAPRLTGRARVAESYYYITRATVQSAQAKPPVPLGPDDLRMLEENFGYRTRPAVDPALALYEASDLQLDIRLDRDTWVRQRSAPQLAVELTGDVRLRKAPRGLPEIFGRVEPVPGRGYIEQFGRNFDFTGGEVFLNGGMEDHLVDIRAEYSTPSASGSGEPDVVVRLAVQGPLDGLKLDLSSEPALSEQEILTYIVTGRNPTGPQTQSGSKGSEAGALATDIGLSQVSGALEGVAQEKIGLDVMQVRYDALQGATLVAGRYVDPVLYLGVRQPLQYRDTGGTTNSNPYRTRFEVEYEAYRWLILNLQGEIDLLRGFLRTRYAY